mgnify:CR=1 FL=1
MFASIGEYVTTTISGVVKRTATIAGLYVFAALMIVCAAGYGLNALYSYLAFSKGAVAASLWIAGGLAVVAIICGGIAYYLGKKPRPSQPVPWGRAALLSAPTVAKLSRSPRVTQIVGRVKTNWKVAAAGGVVALCLVVGRKMMDSEPEA